MDGVTQSIADLNPNDIETMQVLKDAGSASIYGSRACKRGTLPLKGKGKVSGLMMRIMVHSALKVAMGNMLNRNGEILSIWP
ncbi:hypothetical protein CS542_04555 [Pedobacter sp. IW39]|nr:hypothetical protein CS542_04555 [Pedobacter sp. IW39]